MLTRRPPSLLLSPTLCRDVHVVNQIDSRNFFGLGSTSRVRHPAARTLPRFVPVSFARRWFYRRASRSAISARTGAGGRTGRGTAGNAKLTALWSRDFRRRTVRDKSRKPSCLNVHVQGINYFEPTVYAALYSGREFMIISPVRKCRDISDRESRACHRKRNYFL